MFCTFALLIAQLAYAGSSWLTSRGWLERRNILRSERKGAGQGEEQGSHFVFHWSSSARLLRATETANSLKNHRPAPGGPRRPALKDKGFSQKHA